MLRVLCGFCGVSRRTNPQPLLCRVRVPTIRICPKTRVLIQRTPADCARGAV